MINNYYVGEGKLVQTYSLHEAYLKKTWTSRKKNLFGCSIWSDFSLHLPFEFLLILHEGWCFCLKTNQCAHWNSDWEQGGTGIDLMCHITSFKRELILWEERLRFPSLSHGDGNCWRGEKEHAYSAQCLWFTLSSGWYICSSQGESIYIKTE